MDSDAPWTEGALLLIDVINDFSFPGGDDLVRQMPAVVEAIEMLRHRADERQRPVIHVNDNFGRWRSNFAEIIEYCSRAGTPGADVVKRLAPRGHDYFVLKPGQSGFYQTPLPALLEYLEVSSLILAGIAGDQCVLSTAMDAHIRKFDVWVPENATASLTPQRNQRAMDHIREALGGHVGPVGDA